MRPVLAAQSPNLNAAALRKPTNIDAQRILAIMDRLGAGSSDVVLGAALGSGVQGFKGFRV